MSKKNNIKKYAFIAAIAGIGIYLITRKLNETPKPEWWQFAHPEIPFEKLTDQEVEKLLEKVFIPRSGYITCDGTEYVNESNPATVKYLIYIPTGQFISDIDHAFWSKLLTYSSETGYGFKDIKNERIDGITHLKL